MARPLRLELAGALYHVTSRGDGREDIYLTDGDRQLFLDVISGVRERFNWTVHACRPAEARGSLRQLGCRPSGGQIEMEFFIKKDAKNAKKRLFFFLPPSNITNRLIRIVELGTLEGAAFSARMPKACAKHRVVSGER